MRAWRALTGAAASSSRFNRPSRRDPKARRRLEPVAPDRFEAIGRCGRTPCELTIVSHQPNPMPQAIDGAAGQTERRAVVVGELVRTKGRPHQPLIVVIRRAEEHVTNLMGEYPA